jgi:outer membrane protein TolC
MLPQAASTGGFSWSSASQFTNPSFFRVGLQVTNSLLEGGAQWPLLQRTKKSAEAEAERSFLLALGILYQVDFAALHLYAANDAMVAREALLRARQETLRLSASRYAEGLETGAEMVRTLAGVCQARLLLDVAQTDYQLAGYELEAVAPEQPGEHQPQPETHAAIISAPPPREFQPLPATTETEKIWEVLSTPDVRHFPELQYLLNTAPKTEERKNDAAQQDEGKKTNP